MLHIRNMSTSVARGGLSLFLPSTDFRLKSPGSELPRSLTTPVSVTRWDRALGFHDNHGQHQPMYVLVDMDAEGCSRVVPRVLAAA